MFVTDKFYIVDFADGPSLVQGAWLSDDKKFCAWPPQADELYGLAYDKFLQKEEIFPEENWDIHDVLRIRYASGMFFSNYIIANLNKFS